MGILKEGFSAYSSPVMLISRKLTKDKRAVTDFRHLNVRIAKNNLAYPLVSDMFSMLGNSKCKVLSVLHLKDAFHSLRLSETQKDIVVYYHILVVPLIYIKECLWDSTFHPLFGSHTLMQFWTVFKAGNIVKQSWMIFCYLLHQKNHTWTNRRLLRVLLKNGLKIFPKKCQLFRTNLQYMGNEIFIQNKKVCVQPLRNRLEAIQKL